MIPQAKDVTDPALFEALTAEKRKGTRCSIIAKGVMWMFCEAAWNHGY